MCRNTCQKRWCSSACRSEAVGAPQPAVPGAALLETNIPALVPDEVAGREHESVPYVCFFAACLALLASQGAAYSFPFGTVGMDQLLAYAFLAS